MQWSHKRPPSSPVEHIEACTKLVAVTPEGHYERTTSLKQMALCYVNNQYFNQPSTYFPVQRPRKRLPLTLPIRSLKMALRGSSPTPESPPHNRAHKCMHVRKRSSFSSSSSERRGKNRNHSPELRNEPNRHLSRMRQTTRVPEENAKAVQDRVRYLL